MKINIYKKEGKSLDMNQFIMKHVLHCSKGMKKLFTLFFSKRKKALYLSVDFLFSYEVNDEGENFIEIIEKEIKELNKMDIEVFVEGYGYEKQFNLKNPNSLKKASLFKKKIVFEIIRFIKLIKDEYDSGDDSIFEWKV